MSFKRRTLITGSAANHVENICHLEQAHDIEIQKKKMNSRNKVMTTRCKGGKSTLNDKSTNVVIAAWSHAYAYAYLMHNVIMKQSAVLM